MSDAGDHWDRHYGESERVWSGRVNPRLVEIAEALDPGTALDLGCGEGADAVWLAERGWRVVAVDVSEVALTRATAAAETRGVSGNIDFQHHDLAVIVSGRIVRLGVGAVPAFDDQLDRPQILRRAAAVVAPGGLLAIVDHGAAPPWARKHGHDHEFPPAEEVLEGLRLPTSEWDVVRLGPSERRATGPDGAEATLLDNLIVLRRRS